MSSSYQELLVKQVKSIFQSSETYVNARKHAQLKYPTTGAYLELDIWLPDHDISFEFQDSYHYITTWYTHHSQKQINFKDTLKRDLALKQQITFVEVPCWWDGEKQSLSGSIQFYRPDLIVDNSVDSEPIPLNPPFDFFKLRAVPDVGELMLPSFPVDFDIATKSWWLGEKYDGLRCCWNPIRRKLYTRTGARVLLLPQLSKSLFPVFTDSEIWFGRGSFASTQALTFESPEAVSWHSLKLISFDIPPIGIQNDPFEVRYKNLLATIPSNHIFAEIAVRLKCKDNISLNYFVQQIIESGGEGVIMRLARSLYEHGRSDNLLKFKTAYGDEEAVVVAKGAQNSIQLKLPDNRTFIVPAENVHIPTPSIGDVVTFSFDRSSRRDLPVNPSIVRLRTDVSWDDVVYNYMKDQAFSAENINPLPGYTSKPQGYWSKENMRLHLETIMKDKNMDPANKTTWSQMSHKQIKNSKHGGFILRKMKGFRNTVSNLFPEFNFGGDASFSKIENRRKFFEKYAKFHGFDPQKADNWYSQPLALVMSSQGAANVIHYHNKSLTKALIDLFPNINIDKSKLWNKALWENKILRRGLFENYARAKGFDPLVPENWYTQPRIQIFSFKGMYEVLAYHNNDYRQALVDLFPEITLEKSQIGRSSWNTKDSKRKFFERYARVYNFDPLDPTKWYSQPRDQIIRFKKGYSVMVKYNNNVSRALMDVFPDIGLDPSSFIWRKKKKNSSLN